MKEQGLIMFAAAAIFQENYSWEGYSLNWFQIKGIFFRQIMDQKKTPKILNLNPILLQYVMAKKMVFGIHATPNNFLKTT